MIRLVKYALSGCCAILLFLIFYPRTYNVPSYSRRINTRSWDLPTGSTIGYTLVPGTGVKKPYPIVFLQGGPGGFISDRTIAMLSPLSQLGYDVYLYDQIGSGHSARLDNIKEYTADRHKRDLEELIKQIGAEKVILIGQSWGALLATLYVADHAEKVEKLILTGPGPILPVQPALATRDAPDSLHLKAPAYTNAQANKAAHNFRSRAMLQCARVLGMKLASDREADDFQTFLNNELNKSIVCDLANALPAQAGGGFYAQVMTVQSLDKLPDPRAKLKGCKIPLLIMKGQCDNQKWGFTEEYLELFPRLKLVIVPNAGHSIFIEQPVLYLEAISDFLQ